MNTKNKVTSVRYTKTKKLKRIHHTRYNLSSHPNKKTPINPPSPSLTIAKNNNKYLKTLITEHAVNQGLTSNDNMQNKPFIDNSPNLCRIYSMLLDTLLSLQPSGVAVISQSQHELPHNIQLQLHPLQETPDSESTPHHNTTLLGHIINDNPGLTITVNGIPSGSIVYFNHLDSTAPNHRDIFCYINREPKIVSLLLTLKEDPSKKLGAYFWDASIQGVSNFLTEELN